MQLKDVKPDGRYTIVFTANSFDTSGEPPPLLTSNTVRFASGVNIRKEFMTSTYKCDVGLLRDALLAGEGERLLLQAPGQPRRDLQARQGPDDARVAQGRRDMASARRSEPERSSSTRAPSACPIRCRRSSTSSSSKPQAKGAFASFGIFAVLDEANPAIQALGSLSS